MVVCLLVCCRYRRLVLWLPHGLAKGTRLQQLQDVISICELQNPFDATGGPCTPLSYTLTRPSLGTLQLDVPELQPRRRYQVTVYGSSQVWRGAAGSRQQACIVVHQLLLIDCAQSTQRL